MGFSPLSFIVCMSTAYSVIALFRMDIGTAVQMGTIAVSGLFFILRYWLHLKRIARLPRGHSKYVPPKA